MAFRIPSRLLPVSLLTAATIVAAADAAHAGDEFVSATGAYLASRLAIHQGDILARTEFLEEALADSPHETVLLSQTHDSLLSVGRVDEAVRLAGELHHRGLRSASSSITQLVDALKSGDDARVDEAIALLPADGHAGVLGTLAEAWRDVRAGMIPRALETIGAPAKGDGFDPLRAYHRALIHDLAGDAAAAEAAFMGAWQAPGAVAWETARALGGFLERQDRHDDARGVYLRYMDAHPEHRWFESGVDGQFPPVIDADLALSDAFAGIAQHLVLERRSFAALALLNQAAFLAPDDDRIRFMIGNVLAMHGRYLESAEAHGLVSALSPMSWNAGLARARSLHGAGHPDEAMSLLRQMADRRPASAAPFVAIGDILRYLQRWEDAIGAYDDALERLDAASATRAEVLFSQGIALEVSGDWTRAERALLESLEERPDDPHVLNYLGYTWADMGEHLVEALDLIERAVERAPANGMIIDSLGWVLYRLERFNEAVVHLERAAELEPSEPVIIDHLGDAYWMTGRQAEARFQWRRVLGMESTDDALAEVVRQKLQSGLESRGL